MKRLSNKSPCLECCADRQIGNPYSWQRGCERCEKLENWKAAEANRLSAIEDILGEEYDLYKLRDALQKQAEYTEFMERWKGAVAIAGAVKEVGADRAAELVEADKAGRCFVSEIELGGEVFFIPKFNGVPYCGVKKGHVQALSFTRAGKRVKIREHHAHNQDFMLGKTVFRTREEAEAALEKMKEGKA